MFGETREQKAARKELQKRSLPALHLSGLPLPDSAYCQIIFEEYGLTIMTEDEYRKQFSLAYNKITDFQLSFKKNEENTMVSNPGGAIAGALLMGAPGAMLGGRAKKKKVITVEYFLVITYKKDNALENLHFQLREEKWEVVVIKAEKLIEKYRSLTACPAPGAAPVVEL